MASRSSDRRGTMKIIHSPLSRFALYPWSLPSHPSHPCSRPRHHRATLSADTRGCLDTSAAPGNEEVSHNPSHQNGRYSQGIRHTSVPQTHTGHWHSDTGGSHRQPNLREKRQRMKKVCIRLSFLTTRRYLPHFSSSEPSAQSFSPSHRKFSGIQRVLLSQWW